MAQIDVSSALLSIMLYSSFTVQRRVQVVNTFGESTNPNTQSIPTGGVVNASTPADLERLPETERTNKSITIITNFQLRSVFSQSSGANQYLPDIVLWNGDSFVVKNLEDFSNYGPGFISAIAQSIDSVDAPATDITPS